jgi:hypothetical protein
VPPEKILINQTKLKAYPELMSMIADSQSGSSLGGEK